MRIRDKLELPFWTDGTIGVPTTESSIARFHPSRQGDPTYLQVDCEFDLTRIPAEKEWGEMLADAVECRVWIADADGRKWTAANRFPAYALLGELALAQQQRKWYSDYIPFDAPFASPLVEGAKWSTDSREVLAVSIEEEDFFVQLKHCELVFDMAAKPADRVSGAEVHAQLREGMSYEGLDALRKVQHPHWLPSISFGVVGGLERLLHLGGAALNSYGSWETTPFPIPLIFAPTDEEGEPQPGVLVS